MPSSQTSAVALYALPSLQSSLGEVGVRFGWCGVDIHLYALCPPLQPSPSIHPSIPSLPPIPLILFPVPLALRSYLRSSALAIRLSPSPSPSLSLCGARPSRPLASDRLRALTHWRARTHTLPESEREEKKLVSHARTYYSSLLLPSAPRPAPPLPVSAVLSHSLHAPCRRGGGRGWIYTSRCRPRASLRLELACSAKRPQARRLRSRE